MNRIQEGLSQCFHGIKEVAVGVKNGAVSGAHWLGRNVAVLGGHIVDGLEKVIGYAKPYFNSLGTTVANNKPLVLVALGAAALGAALYSVMNRACATAKPAATPASA